MERFDVLDREGQPMGKTACKGVELPKGQFYLGVHAYIHNARGEFLLQQRALDKAFRPGGWDVHMGHVVAGETSLEAVRREVHEEVGLPEASLAPQLIGRMVWDCYHHLIDIYAIELEFDLASLVMQPEEVIGVKSVPAQEMMGLIQAMDYRPEGYRDLVSRYLRTRGFAREGTA